MREIAAKTGATLNAKIIQERAAWLANRKDGTWFEAIIKELTGESEVTEWTYGEHGYDEIGIFMQMFNRGRKRLIPSAVVGFAQSTLFHAKNEHVAVDKIKLTEDLLIRKIQSPELKSKTYSIPS